MEKKAYKGFDAVFNHINEFGGRYQMVLYFSSCLIFVPLGMQLASLVFAMGTPQFHCSDQLNSTCPPNKCCDNCTSYVFDGPFTSVVSDWNLICDRAYLAAIAQSVFMAGMLVGSFGFGLASDAFGRRKTIFFTTLLLVTSGVCSAFADCLSLFAVLRFVVGASLTGLMVTQFVFGMELVGPSKRAMGGKLQDLYWFTAASASVLASYFIRDWSNLILACSLPSLIVFLFWRVFPESPRWLAANGHLQDACAVLLKFKGKNGKTLDADTIMEALQSTDQENIQENKGKPTLHKIVDMLRAKKLRKRLLIIAFLWFTISMSFFGFLLYIPNLSGDLYLNFFLMFLVDLPHTPIGWFLIQTFGRRVPFAMFLLLGGGTCLLSLAAKDHPQAIIAITMLGKFFCSSAFSLVYIYTSELFPTSVRNLAVGSGSMCARLGGIIAPFIVMLSQLPNVSVTLPIVIIGVVTIASGVLSLWLPETLGSAMHQTIEEAEAAPESYEIPCRLPCRRGFDPVPVNDGTSTELVRA